MVLATDMKFFGKGTPTNNHAKYNIKICSRIQAEGNGKNNDHKRTDTVDVVAFFSEFLFCWCFKAATMWTIHSLIKMGFMKTNSKFLNDAQQI